MRYKVSESQRGLLEELGRRKGVREQEFIAQSSFSSPMGESSEPSNGWYTVNVTILSGVDELETVNPSKLDDRTFFKMVNEDVRKKIEESFGTKEFTIHSISSKTRGEMNPLYLD